MWPVISVSLDNGYDSVTTLAGPSAFSETSNSNCLWTSDVTMISIFVAA